MSDSVKKKKIELTPRQQEIKKLRDKGVEKRTDQETARLDQLKMEERRDRFLRLAVQRVQRADKALRAVARLGTKVNYEYTPDEAARIVQYVADLAVAVQDAFLATPETAREFTL